MGRSQRARVFWGCLVIATWATALLEPSGAASGQPQSVSQDVEVHRSRVSGLAKFVKPAVGATLPVQPRGQRPVEAADAIREYGHLFGVEDPERELVLRDVQGDAIGHSHTTYLQYHRGVPVFSSVLKVHQNREGEVVALNGDFHPIPPALDTSPTLNSQHAVALARGNIAVGDPAVEESELVIVDPGWYGDPPRGERLAYYVILTDASVPLREAFFVDAHSGEILDQWTLIQNTPAGLGPRRDLRESAATEQR